jgi:hypothetical protein
MTWNDPDRGWQYRVKITLFMTDFTRFFSASFGGFKSPICRMICLHPVHLLMSTSKGMTISPMGRVIIIQWITHVVGNYYLKNMVKRISYDSDRGWQCWVKITLFMTDFTQYFSASFWGFKSPICRMICLHLVDLQVLISTWQGCHQDGKWQSDWQPIG